MKIVLKPFSIVALTIIALTSCEKVTTVELPTASINYVIEGMLTNEPGGAQITISQTKPLSDNNMFLGVSSAVVVITHKDTTFTLNEVSPGVYKHSILAGISENSYQLSVKVGGKSYQALCTMPKVVALKNISVIQEKSIDNDTFHKVITAEFNDPSGENNYYRFTQKVNGIQERTVYVENDDFADGQTISVALRYKNGFEDPIRYLQKGDRVVISMLTISQPIYRYWASLAENASGSDDVSAPSNPVTNITGGALGYFSAHTIQTSSIEIK